MRHARTSTMWLLAAALSGLAGIIWIAAAGQAALGLVFLGVAAMFFVFSMTIAQARDED